MDSENTRTTPNLIMNPGVLLYLKIQYGRKQFPPIFTYVVENLSVRLNHRFSELHQLFEQWLQQIELQHVGAV